MERASRPTSLAGELLDALVARVRLGPRRPLALGPDALSAQWSAIRAVWRRGRGGVYLGPFGFAATVTPEARLVRDVAERGSEGEALAFAHLEDPDASVAGHCLAVLARRRSELLRHLPPSLLARQERIEVHDCKVFAHGLGEWAALVAERGY